MEDFKAWQFHAWWTIWNWWCVRFHVSLNRLQQRWFRTGVRWIRRQVTLQLFYSKCAQTTKIYEAKNKSEQFAIFSLEWVNRVHRSDSFKPTTESFSSNYFLGFNDKTSDMLTKIILSQVTAVDTAVGTAMVTATAVDTAITLDEFDAILFR